jgi:hypothetical protein
MLHTLNVDYASEDFNIHDFTDAIQSRIISNKCLPPDIARLQTVEINCNYEGVCASDSAVLSWLRQSRAIGLEMTVLHNGKVILCSVNMIARMCD